MLQVPIKDHQNASSGHKAFYFNDLFEHSVLKYGGIIWSLACIILITALLGGIIYYEKFGSDQKRIFNNRMVSSICWTLIEAYVTVVAPDVILYSLKSLPVGICYVLVVARQALIIRLLLLFDSIIVARYLFIFRIKNPLSLDDKFWSTIVNVWIVMMSFIIQTVYIIMPGRQPFPFYLCCNTYSDVIDSQPFKSNNVILAMLAFSLIIHLIVQVKIMIHKSKDKTAQPKTMGIILATRQKNFEDWNLTSFIANICSLMSTGLFLFTVYRFNRLEPSKFNQYPFYLYIYYLSFVYPFLVSGTIAAIFYINNPAMRRWLKREIKTCISDCKDKIASQLYTLN